MATQSGPSRHHYHSFDESFTSTALAPPPTLYTRSSASTNHQVYRMVTSAFLHGGFLHLGFNMFNLKTAGKMVEEFGRPIMYLGTYILCAIAGNFAQYPRPGYGASGAGEGPRTPPSLLSLRFALGATPDPPPFQPTGGRRQVGHRRHCGHRRVLRGGQAGKRSSPTKQTGLATTSSASSPLPVPVTPTRRPRTSLRTR